MESYTTVVFSSFGLLVYNRLHPRNFLIAFDATPSARHPRGSSDSFGNSETSFNEYTDIETGQSIVVYKSQPLYKNLEGQSFTLDRLKIKITDFGKGLFIEVVIN